MRTEIHPSIRTRSRAFVLLAVLVLILLLSMITLSLLFRSKGDEAAGHATSGSEQAWSAAMSGVEEAMRVAAAAPAGSTDWQDDPGLFRARSVYQDGAEEWFFTVFSPASSIDTLVDTRYGLSDEAGRLNLNHPGDADLTKIPGLAPALAGEMRQFIGQAPAPASASGLQALDAGPPAADSAFPDDAQVLSGNEIPRHGPLATLDELLLLPGFSRALLHGAPLTNDYQVAPNANGNGPEFPMENLKPKRNHGLDQYFTVFSRDPGRSNAGGPRCNLNDPGDSLPVADLPAGFSNYVATLRAAGFHLAHPGDALEATVTATNNQGVEVEASSGITKENLAGLLDLFATDKESGHDGLINVNTASSVVLATLPGIDLPLAESIVSTRAGLSPERRATIAWLYQEGVVDAQKFKAIAPSLTARSAQFRFNVIGYGLPSGRYRVLEAVIDLAGTDPRVIYLRDITRLGLPISLKEENTAKPDGTAALFETPGSVVCFIKTRMCIYETDHLAYPIPPHG